MIYRSFFVRLLIITHLFMYSIVVAIRRGQRSNNLCTEQCNLHRPEGSTDAYIIKCDNETLSEAERQDCVVACTYCFPPENICNQTIKPRQIQCRSTVLTEGPCKRRCDYQRPEGNYDKFSFTCDDGTLFPTGWDIRQCTNDCVDCPPTVCLRSTEEFHCPAVDANDYMRPPPPPSEPPYEGSKCEWRCDQDRPVPERRRANDAYEFGCEFKYESKSKEKEKLACIADCFSCPLEVCDAERSPGIYACPKSRLPLFPEPPRASKFIVSWTIIAMIAFSVIGCIVATNFYGRINRINTGPPLPTTLKDQERLIEVEWEMDRVKSGLVKPDAYRKESESGGMVTIVEESDATGESGHVDEPEEEEHEEEQLI